MIWWALGLGSVAFIAFCVWWLIHIGKTIARGEETSRQEGLLEKQVTDRNRFIKDVDKLAREKSGVKDEVHKAFDRGASIGDVVVLLDRARGLPKVSKADKP